MTKFIQYSDKVVSECNIPSIERERGKTKRVNWQVASYLVFSDGWNSLSKGDIRVFVFKSYLYNNNVLNPNLRVIHSPDETNTAIVYI